MILQQQIKKSPAGQPGLATDKGISSANPSYCKYSLLYKRRSGKTQAEILLRINRMPQGDHEKLKLLFDRLCIRHFGYYKGDLSHLWLRLQKGVNVDRERARIMREVCNG